MSKILIEVEKGKDEAETLRHVARLIEEGNTSGFHPTWDILKDEVEVRFKDKKSRTIQGFAVMGSRGGLCILNIPDIKYGAGKVGENKKCIALFAKEEDIPNITIDGHGKPVKFVKAKIEITCSSSITKEKA